MYKEIKDLLGAEITVGKRKVPVAHLRYTGKEKTFIVWNMNGERPEILGDDKYLYDVAEVDIDIYSDTNYVDILNHVKKLFIDNDWYYIESSPEMFENDEKMYHITLTFEKEKMING